jgi:hypothetical protein
MPLKIVMLATFLSTICFVGLAAGQVVKINVPQVLEARITSLAYNNYSVGVPMKLSAELFNPGSVGYDARFRLDIYSDNCSSSIWSRELPMQPGVRSGADMYWYDPECSGEFSGRLRVYYANEIKETNLSFMMLNASEPQDALTLSDFRTYDNNVKFSLKARQGIENLIIYASGYPSGWIFEEVKVERVSSGDKISVQIPYKASLWIPSDIRIVAFTADGKFFSGSYFSMAKEEGVMKYIHYLLDWISVKLKI